MNAAKGANEALQTEIKRVSKFERYVSHEQQLKATRRSAAVQSYIIRPQGTRSPSSALHKYALRALQRCSQWNTASKY